MDDERAEQFLFNICRLIERADEHADLMERCAKQQQPSSSARELLRKARSLRRGTECLWKRFVFWYVVGRELDSRTRPKSPEATELYERTRDRLVARVRDKRTGKRRVLKALALDVHPNIRDPRPGPEVETRLRAESFASTLKPKQAELHLRLAETAEDAGLAAELESLIRRLSPRQAEFLLEMLDIELDETQAAAEMKIDPGTARRHLFDIREKS